MLNFYTDIQYLTEALTVRESCKHSLYGYNTHKGIVAHIELYF